MVWWWLGVALVVDGIDGPLARKYDIKNELPMWNGSSLDYVVDYSTYVFIPAFALALSDLMPTLWGWATAGVITLAGALYFAYDDMKMPDNCFRGFPAAWNIPVLLFFIYKPEPLVIVGITLFLAVLSFTPIRFIHPVRVTRLRMLTMVMIGVWALSLAGALFYDLSPPDWLLWVIALSTVYVSLIGLYMQLTEKPQQPA
jgi:phosphatidylcholine synthase